MKKRILIIVAAAALLVTGTIYATVRHAGNLPLVDRLVSHISRQLELTDAQETQVKSILEAERAKVAPLLAQAAKNRQQLHQLTASGKFDEAQVRTLAAQQAQTMTELIVEKERVKSKIYNEVLTPEQKSKADQLLDRMHAQFGEGMHKHFGGNEPAAP